MIGILKLTPTGIIARSGFKYIRFDPPISILSERGMVVYKDIGYEFQDNIIHVSFNDSDIKKETMSAIVLNDCKILNQTNRSGKCTARTGERSIILTEDFKLAPIVTRIFKGQTPDRNDIQVYSKDDYIKFQVKWDRDGLTRTITSSIKNIDEDGLWKLLKGRLIDLDTFLSQQPRSASNIQTRMVYDRTEMNKSHFYRFKNRYKAEFKINHDIDMDLFKSMDVIDLTNIQEIKIDNVTYLKNYAVYEISPDTIKCKGIGFTKQVLDKLLDRRDKFYVMLIDDSIEHRIRKHTYATLYINTKILVPETMEDKVDVRPEMVFLKFNKLGLKKWLTTNIISHL